MIDTLNQIAELAEELCDARQHREPVYEWTPARHRKLTATHTTIQPGLLEQLRDSIYPTATLGEGGTRSLPKSRPPLLLEALSHHIAITTGANQWTWTLKLVNRGTVESNIRNLVGAANNLDDDTRHTLTADLRRWRNWAAVMTGWANPPLCPRVPCPHCAALSTLRILPERKAAMCSKCDHVWDSTDGSIEALAEWVTQRTDNPAPHTPIRSSTAGHGGWQNRNGS